MMSWCKILPFFFVEWWAKRFCEIQKQHHGGYYYKTFVSPFGGVEIDVNGRRK